MNKRSPSFLSASKIRVYLCGPINGCTDEECKDWREWIKSHFPDAIDPMRRDYRGKEAESYREIVELDKRDVEAADVVLVNYEKPNGAKVFIYRRHSDGHVHASVHDYSRFGFEPVETVRVKLNEKSTVESVLADPKVAKRIALLHDENTQG